MRPLLFWCTTSLLFVSGSMDESIEHSIHQSPQSCNNKCTDGKYIVRPITWNAQIAAVQLATLGAGPVLGRTYKNREIFCCYAAVWMAAAIAKRGNRNRSINQRNGNLLPGTVICSWMVVRFRSIAYRYGNRSFAVNSTKGKPIKPQWTY